MEDGFELDCGSRRSCRVKSPHGSALLRLIVTEILPYLDGGADCALWTMHICAFGRRDIRMLFGMLLPNVAEEYLFVHFRS